jgi:hypothetical protein
VFLISLKELLMATIKYSSIDQQVSLVQAVASNPAGRAEFLSSPAKFAAKHKVALDPKFQAVIVKELQMIEVESARLGHRNPYIDVMQVKIPKLSKQPSLGQLGLRGPVMNAAAVAAGAAVVSAVAAVVSAGTAVYNSTKFAVNPGIGGRIR